ncbi:MAG TPA: PQQ-binding-like beta-propeller repeat protein [Bacteroidetes bacterium]|nr:PQQ-binding-like beta-propeller repeat protein [Bacteroidota bacterium]
MGSIRRYIIVSLFAFAGLASLVAWMATDPTRDFTASMPGADNRGIEVAVEENIVIGEFFALFENDVVGGYTGKWPRFRGVNYDNIVTERQDIKDSWSDADPEIRWTIELGEGHAGAAIYEGRVYILDYIEESREDALRCFSLSDGEELWRRSYGVHIKRNHGMSRTVPAVTERYVVTIGPRCQVMCVDRINGDFIWGLDMAKQYGVEVPQWYTAQCPLIDGDKAILAPGGSSVAMIAVDLNTGEILWEAPNNIELSMSHSSIIPGIIHGKRMYVYSADGGIVAVGAEGDDEGKIMWESKVWNHSVVAPSPVILDDGKIFLTAGYGAGSMMIQVTPDGDGYNVESLVEYAPREGLACEQQTPILWNGHLFGIIPKDGGANRSQLVCVSPDNVQNLIWSSGTVRFGLGPYIIAEDKMYILSDDGTLVMVRPDTKSYIEIGRKKLFDGTDAWAPLAIADGLMLLRDSKTMLCVDI